MNERIEHCLYQAGLTAQGCWDELDDYTKQGIEKFAQLIVRECRDIVEQDMKLAHIQMIPLTLEKYANGRLKEKIKEHFGVEE